VPGSTALIVYSNAAFLVDRQGNFYIYNSPTVLSAPMGSKFQMPDNQDVHPPGKEDHGPFYYFDGFTGSGEVVGAAKIAQFLTTHGEPFEIKRSHIVSIGDVAESNAIFLGGGFMDQLVNKIPTAQELVLEPAPPGDFPTGSQIRDKNPPPGHPATYRMQLDPATSAIRVDYGLISLLPGISSGRRVLVLAGLTTLGTEAAAEFVVSEPQMALLEQKWAAAPAKSRSPYFQALLEVEVRDGVPLGVKCLLVRELNNR
jgi:hypothetical protein